MSAPLPPTRPGYPTKTINSILQSRPTIDDIRAICDGAYPLTYETIPSATVDTFTFSAVPQGKLRILVLATGYGDINGCAIALYLNDTIIDCLAYPTYESTTTRASMQLVRPVCLLPGTALVMMDEHIKGGNVFGTIGYVDVIL